MAVLVLPSRVTATSQVWGYKGAVLEKCLRMPRFGLAQQPAVECRIPTKLRIRTNRTFDDITVPHAKDVP